MVLCLILGSCKESKPEEIPAKEDGLITVTETQFKSNRMEMTNLTEQNFDVSVKASGKIDVPPQNRAQVTTFIGGYVKSTTLLVGNKVTKGQALLTLQSTELLDIQKEYLEVAEQLNYLKSEYDRQKTLYDEKITSQKNYLKAESEYKRAKALYQSLRAKLVLLNVNPQRVEKGNLTSTFTIFSPITAPIDPPIKRKSIQAIVKGYPLHIPDAVLTASFNPVFFCDSISRSLYFFVSTNSNGSSEVRFILNSSNL